MTEWEPATDAEIAMRNALRTDDQESYFRILAGVDLLLPVSADALAGLAPLGWGTWSTGGRTHVLAFTSPSALQACLADYTGSARRVAYQELADTWPNLEWWLAVNPGLPIEGYLPAWFVAQLSRGDLRLPTRGPGREGSNAPNRIQDLHAAATLAATAAAQGYNAAAQTYAGPESGGPIPGSPAPSGASGSPAYGGSSSGGPAYGAGSGAPGSGGPAYGAGSGGPGSGGPGSGGPAYGAGSGGPGSGGPGSGGPAYRAGSGGAGSGGAGSGGSAYGGAATSGTVPGRSVPSGSMPTGPAGSGGGAPAGLASGSTSSGGSAPLAGSAASSASAYAGSSSDGRFSGDSAGGGSAAGLGGRLPDSSSSAAAGSGAPVGPGGLPLRTPGAVLPSGLPSRVPGTPAGHDGGIPGGQFNGFGTLPGPRPAQPGGPAADQPGNRGSAGGPAHDPGSPSARPGESLTQPGSPSARLGGSPAQPGGPPARPGGGLRPSAGAAGEVPAAYQPPTLPPSDSAGSGPRSAPGSSALSALGSRTAAPTGGTPAAPQPLQRPDSPLPTRTPMAQTPPLPAHIPPPPGTDDVPGGSGETGARGQDDDQSTPPGGLPRRQVTAPEERPPSMAAAAQALAGNRAAPPATQEPAKSAQPGLAPPVIPGAGGAGRSASTPIVPAGASRPTIPPATSTPGTQPPGAAPSRPDPAPARPGNSGPEAPEATTTATGDARTTGAGIADARTTGADARTTGADTADAATTDAGTTDADATPGGGPADTWSTGTGSGTGTGTGSGTGTGTGSGSGPGTGSGSGPGTGGESGQDGPVGTAADYADSRTSFDDDFVPANEVERDLYRAVDESSTDSFLSTLLLATVLVPVASNSRPGSAPGESGFAFRTEEIDGDRFLVVFTSRDRIAEHFAEPTRTVGVRFVDLIRNWPDPAWSFAVNPTSPIGAKYPGPQVIALATWAVEAGLGGEPVDAPVPQPQPAEATAQLTMMQKAVPAEQVDYYLERGYDRVAGFVHRSGEVEHLRSPGDLFAALGLLYDGSPYQGDAKEAFVLRWPAHRPSLYRIPYGGQSEQALRAMDGWVIERPPFRGNGFAPGEGKDVIAEFKVDSVRLPHGAQLWRMDADGAEQMIAVFDCDAPVWRRVGEQ